MWTRKTFIVYLFIAGGIAAYLTYDTLKLDPAERFDGPGGGFGLIIAYALAYGAGLGIFVRLLGFLFAYRKIQRKFYWALLILAPILLIGMLSIPSYYKKWERRPPTAQCDYDNANLSIGKTLINVPTFSIISTALDDGNQFTDRTDNLYFFSNESFRKYCAKTDNGKSRLPVNAVSVNFSRIETEKIHNGRFQNLCQKEDYFFCKEGRYFGVVPYVESLNMYYTGHYNADKMYGSTGETLIAELNANVSDEDYFKYNFIKMDDLRGNDGSAVTFRCRNARKNLFCQTNVAFSEDVRVIAGYVVSHESTESDIRKLYKDSLEFIDNIKVNEVSHGL